MPPARLRVQRTASRDMNTPTPRTDAEHLRILFDDSIELNHEVDHMTNFARQLERDIAELNQRLIDRHRDMMATIVSLRLENDRLKSLLPESVVDDLREVSPAS